MTEEERSITERFRESHHAVARMFAAGMTPSMIRQKTGYSMRRLALLSADPTFQLLIVHYAKSAIEKWEEVDDIFQDLGISNLITAERQLADKLEAADVAGEYLPTRELIQIVADRADRFGYSKHTVHEVRHDFAARLDRAIDRSKKVIDVTPKEALVEIAPKHHPPLAPLAPRQKREPPERPVSGPLIRRKVA